jgi:hypothetical protein
MIVMYVFLEHKFSLSQLKVRIYVIFWLFRAKGFRFINHVYVQRFCRIMLPYLVPFQLNITFSVYKNIIWVCRG